MLKQFRFLLTVLSFSLFLGCSGGGSSSDDNNSLSRNACPALGLSPRIIDGTACGERDAPVVEVHLLYRNGTGALCSGVLLSEDQVLTAAHCFFERVVSAIVEVGEQRSPASEVVLHPNVGVSEELLAVFNDVAIVTLARPITGRTLPLLMSRNVREGDSISIFGYGLDNDGNVGALRSGEMRVSSVTPNHIFAEFRGGGSNTCNGDSGGPAVLTFDAGDGSQRSAVVGIVSSGSLVTCEEGDVSLFTNTQTESVLTFILNQVPGVAVE